MSLKKLKDALRERLKKQDLDLRDIMEFMENPQAIVSPLISFLPETDRFLRWHAITCLGIASEEISKRDLEQARILVRRLMWQLNDESGGIGWGCPEAIGEILSRTRPLAEEYATILVSYVYEEENFLEQPALIEGALWGIARVSQSCPETVTRARPRLLRYLEHPKAETVIYALLALENLKALVDNRITEQLKKDTRSAEIYWNGRFQHIKVSEIVKNLGG